MIEGDAMNGRSSWRIVVWALLIGSFATASTVAVRPAMASHLSQPFCDSQITYTAHTPSVTADGATLQWQVRSLFANDWAQGGFSAQVLWVGTDGAQADTKWVEAGITHGWQGANLFRFYTAHGNLAVSPEIYAESLFPSAPTPPTGSTPRFKVYSVASPGTPLYRAQVDSGGSSYYVTWSGHGPNTVDYSGGYEARGPDACEARVDATYVYQNKFRRKSDGVYIGINNGIKVDDSTQGTIGWCAQPTTFRYWMHSQISGLVCP